MRSEIRTLCIQYIIEEWHKLPLLNLRDEPPIPPPWGVWIRFYDPIPFGTNVIDDSKSVLRKTWFLDKQGVQERDPWEYARFITVNSDCPWAAENLKPHMTIWGTVHQIGLAAFAEVIGTDAIYLETQWGVRWGHGYQMKINEDGVLQIERTLWFS